MNLPRFQLAASAIFLWLLCSFFVSDKAHSGKAIQDNQSEENARREVGLLMQAPDFRTVQSMVPRWRVDLPAPVQKQIILLLLRNLGSENKLSFEKEAKERQMELRKARHNLFTEGGRSAWTLEFFFSTTIPSLKDLTVEEKSRFQQRVYEIVINEMSLPYSPMPGLGSLTVAERVKLAADKNASQVVLHRLALDPNVEVRLAVAQNTRTRDGILHLWLKNDPSPEVRAAALKRLSEGVITVPF